MDSFRTNVRLLHLDCLEETVERIMMNIDKEQRETMEREWYGKEDRA